MLKIIYSKTYRIKFVKPTAYGVSRVVVVLRHIALTHGLRANQSNIIVAFIGAIAARVEW
jgi:hypothetical protein